jgi:hypothetical protein
MVALQAKNLNLADRRDRDPKTPAGKNGRFTERCCCEQNISVSGKRPNEIKISGHCAQQNGAAERGQSLLSTLVSRLPPQCRALCRVGGSDGVRGREANDRLLPAPHQTGQAVFPHPAFRVPGTVGDVRFGLRFPIQGDLQLPDFIGCC